MNKNGKIILLDSDKASNDALCSSLKALGHKNEVLCFDDAEAAGYYLSENSLDVFLLLQNNTSQAVQIPDTRNMVYMHEKFKTDAVPHMFMVLTKDRQLTGRLHTFVHCYYKPAPVNELAATLGTVVDFWKDHVFPPRVGQL